MSKGSTKKKHTLLSVKEEYQIFTWRVRGINVLTSQRGWKELGWTKDVKLFKHKNCTLTLRRILEETKPASK